jgi:predicted membrane protein
MRQKYQFTIGVFIILFGLMLLISNLTGIHLLSYIWPLLLIVLGIWMIVRPSRFNLQPDVRFRFLGGKDHSGHWSVKDESIVSFIGDVHLDLTQADIPAGETHIELRGFVGDINVIIPAFAGIAVRSSAFMTSANAFGIKRDYFLTSYAVESDNFATAENKIRLDLGFFVTDLNLQQTNS